MNNINNEETGKDKFKTRPQVSAQDVDGMKKGSDDEASFDSGYNKAPTGYDDVSNPTTGKDDKAIDLDRSGSAYQRAHSDQQNTTGDRVAKLAAHNAGMENIGEGSAQGYEGNTDDSGLDALGEDILSDGTDDNIEGQDLSGVDLTGAGGDDIDDVGDVGRVSH